ncbi:NLI interacting factor-like phosphatase-domain-containing protein [Halteromyces radiatus]|uniref:NLI interacting factor-like phosphatase-domain-containing protein n=1 Tax=Halteromyces radiatus TaxID=101107 RepID=UPI00221F5148|nr:NLI interacting factor-like phosphatase-domain-containing protein [Halteromyces radiatus]KAI8084654.1 NLI interacting factor-like phosphatase-domain-containing protein [Halteromyces radiatus]
MDLKSMLIGDIQTISSDKTFNPSNTTPTPMDPKILQDKTALLHLGGSLQAYLHKSAQRSTNTITNATSSSLRLGPELAENPSLWRPTISLQRVAKEIPSFAKRPRSHQQSNFDETLPIQLITHEIGLRKNDPRLILENTYDIQGSYRRGFFVLMAQRNMPHTFVFYNPDHPWFEDLYGLRKSAYIVCKAEDGALWEVHLKPARGKGWLFGYLIKQDDVIRMVKESRDELMMQRKLPLVLDLDDTLVRLVGEGSERFVPENDLPKYGNRVAVLKDGRRVALTARVHEFLEWAQNFYDISVCSLGDQNYVENVVEVLDPQRTRIRGILYSARSEHDFIKQSHEPGRPPKDLRALYSFCALQDKSLGSAFTLPLILDDETRMWPTEQHDNIIEVKQQLGSEAWNVSLFPVVQETLAHIHMEFFRQLDTWYSKQVEAENNGYPFTREPPSALAIYKTYLRHMLRDMITKVHQ